MWDWFVLPEALFLHVVNFGVGNCLKLFDCTLLFKIKANDFCCCCFLFLFFFFFFWVLPPTTCFWKLDHILVIKIYTEETNMFLMVRVRETELELRVILESAAVWTEVHYRRSINLHMKRAAERQPGSDWSVKHLPNSHWSKRPHMTILWLLWTSVLFYFGQTAGNIWALKYYIFHINNLPHRPPLTKKI